MKSLVRTRGLIDSVSYGHEAIVRRLGRVAFMVVGAAIGVGSFVIATGLSTTVRAQVSSEFDIRLATQVVAHEAGSSAALTLFEDVPEAVTSLPGVEAAALVAAGAIDLSPLPPLLSRSQPAIAMAATANFLEAVEVDWQTGRGFDAEGDDGQPVVVLGASIQESLGPIPQRGVLMFVDGVPHSVVGVLRPSLRMPELNQSIVLPWDRRNDYQLLEVRLFARVSPGAALRVADDLPLAASPNDPTAVGVLRPLDPRELRLQVDDQLRQFLTVIGAVAMLLSAIAIMNSSLVSIGERTPEIGLSRANGVTRLEIFVQFLYETALVGAIAGVLGAGLALLGLVVISWANQWAPVIDRSTPLIGALMGLGTGVIAGGYPAFRAATTMPIAAIRSAESR